MNLNPFEIAYIYLNSYALYTGCLLLTLVVAISLIRRKRLGIPIKIMLVFFAIIGCYLILWDLRILNFPYRSPDLTAQNKSEEILNNQRAAKQVDFKTFDVTYTPAYLRSWAKFYSVLQFTDQNPGQTQVNIEYAKYLTGANLNSEGMILSESKPVIDIRQESTRDGSCTSSYPLNNFTAIGTNDAGNPILKASTTAMETAYLTDYMGTRLMLESCSVSNDNRLTDEDALKTFRNLRSFDIRTADFSDPRT